MLVAVGGLGAPSARGLGADALARWLAQPVGERVPLDTGSGRAAWLALPKTHLTPDDIGLVINANDPSSVKIGEYYRERRGIPDANVVRVSLPTGTHRIAADVFEEARRRVGAALPERVQAYALAWRRPWRVDCMSITSAFAFGFDRAYCSGEEKRCGPTRQSPYYSSISRAPYDDHGMRPAMMLAAESFADAQALIDRGVQADGSLPDGRAYLVSTSNKARNVRAEIYPEVAQQFSGHIGLEVVEADALRNRDDVMFYFTGIARVEDIETNRFLPGAVADHLTSGGGRLIVSDQAGQMSALRWLQAGAAGSYGAVVEPCNFPRKFPNPGLVIGNYLQGRTLIEAYWKSVAWPGEGVFIGEPLARPYGRTASASIDDGVLTLATHGLGVGRYVLLSAPGPAGPYVPEATDVLEEPLGERRLRFKLGTARHAAYRVIRTGPPPAAASRSRPPDG